MAKRKTKENTETTPVTEQPALTAATAVSPSDVQDVQRDEPSAHAPDPGGKISVGLSAHRGGPSMHLLRSQKFNQMQIRFDGEQPGEQYLAMLANGGWKDRTEAEGVWTKQIDRNRRWQSVQQMEREFREVANAIRRDKGLAPALEGMVVG